MASECVEFGGSFPSCVPALWNCASPSARGFHLPRLSDAARLRIRAFARNRTGCIGNRLSAQEFFESFLRQRQANGDFISKASDALWKKEVLEVDEERCQQIWQELAKLQKIKDEKADTGFLKLSQAKTWSLGVDMAPTNARITSVEKETVHGNRRMASFLEYEALKRELSLLAFWIAAACSVYCLLVFSTETALSYGIGAVGSFLYLQLLFHHADRISEDNVARVFCSQRPKRIGVRSSDLRDLVEKTFSGSAMALSSPRLFIPAILFVLWAICHNSTRGFFELQLAPLMLGFFNYKASVLIQAYRDNKDLITIFPESTRKLDSE